MSVKFFFEETDRPTWWDEYKFKLLSERIIKDKGKEKGTISVVISNDKFIHHLNRRYRSIDSPTDVLSFHLEDDFDASDFSDDVQGEVYISIERAKEQAFKAGVPLEEEVVRLLAHGILHLTGMDHKDEAEKMMMTESVERYLKQFSSLSSSRKVSS